MKHLFKIIFVFALVLTSCNNDDDSNVTPANGAPVARECPSTSNLVGQSRDFTANNQYRISGTVTIVSDCEIEISNFFYNGLGPNVSVYAGVNNNFDNGVNMSERLNGRRFEGETLRFFLPEGSTFNEFNSISIWCFEFDIDFSSVSF